MTQFYVLRLLMLQGVGIFGGNVWWFGLREVSIQLLSEWTHHGRELDVTQADVEDCSAPVNPKP